jgi:succinate-semialdehyde dehydrogenase/glutarate-semialdehyde dehydrogenase
MPSFIFDQAFINGQWVSAQDARTYPVFNPYNGALIASVADLTQTETRMAIEAAEKAFFTWSKVPARDRARILRKWFELIVRYADDLAHLLTLEQGKPIAEAKGEILYGASFIEWFAEEGPRVYGDIIPGHAIDKRIVVLRQPIGVCGIITPWNFPNAMLTRKVGAALSAGCTVVAKPAEDTPLSALALAFLSEEARLPPGVLNIVTTSDPARVGGELLKNKVVKKISFTGSTEVGKMLIRESADTVKKLSLELGGNAPFIVFEDADIDAAVSGAVFSKYRNAGQTCVCANRIFVQSGVYDIFVEKLTRAVGELKMGNGMNEGIHIGPLINEAAIRKVSELVEDAVNKGGKVSIGGKQSDLGGQFYEPTVLTEVRPDMAISQEEIFGPVAPVYRFQDEEEVIRLANDTPYGLAAYFYGRDISLIWRVAEALEYGMVGINTGMISTAVAPFGGIKESGYGREGSRYGIEEYLEMKYLCFEV